MKSARAIAAEIVLHHDDGVAGVPQPLQQSEQPVDVSRVQADRGFIEHVERVHQVGAQRVGERDPLRFAARERSGKPVEGQIAESYVP